MEKKTKQTIKENFNKLPLSFAELNYKRVDKKKVLGKIIQSKNYKDGNYTVSSFYKPIVRFV